MGKLSVAALGVSVVVAASPAGAFAQTSTDTTVQVVTPNHLEVGGQVFDASVSGFRAYLESKRASDPRLYAALDPKVARLESQAATGRAVAVAGLVVGLAATGYAMFGGRSCAQPEVTDPNFAADTAAWSACNEGKVNTALEFGLIGVGAISLGGLGWWALSPKRSDLFDLVNAHNTLSPDTMRLQIGYDPTSHLAIGGVRATF